MPRKKQQQRRNQAIPEDYFGGSVEYGMDDYDNPLDHMSQQEMNEFADYIAMIQNKGGKYGIEPQNGEEIDDEEYLYDEDDSEDSDEEDSDDEDIPPSYAPPPDPLYPGDNYAEDSDDSDSD